MIFVFGSNLAGIHGAGAAKHAVLNEGAMYGVGVGLQGNSYALPTKNHKIVSLTLGSIAQHVDDFIQFAQEHPELEFKVTRVGCGLAGFKDNQIAPMFLMAPYNCYFDMKWHHWLGDKHQYWGSQ